MPFEIKKITDLSQRLSERLPKDFGLANYEVAECLQVLNTFLSGFRTDLYAGIEFPYVDKVYRNSYYSYFSSKLLRYKRDCIRLSFFSGGVGAADFLSEEGAAKLQSRFMGFLVLRPNGINIIGRNVLRPDVYLKTSDYLVKTTSFGAAINGIKLTVEGFPHSSQDTELMVCAETTIWSVMEYFSHNYAEYTPVLPQDIHKILSHTSMQRQVPSSGLTALQISYALKELGFGVKSYSQSGYGGIQFYRLIQSYVESGIPVVAAIANDTGIGHVMNIVGRTGLEDPTAFPFTEMVQLANGASLYDYYEQPAKYVVVDDNLPPYSLISLEDPACNYSHPQWKDCRIFAAIVPLHKQIWMEADRAKVLAIEELFEISQSINLPPAVLKVFLTSSRSFKNYIAVNPDLDIEVKVVVNTLKMSKFVWIAELSTPELLSQGKITGLILMDATEPKKYAVLATLLENTYIGTIRGQENRYKVNLPPFREFVNLKSY